MYFSKDNRKRHAEAAAVRKQCKQQLAQQQRTSIYPAADLKLLSKDYSTENMECCECQTSSQTLLKCVHGEASARKKYKKANAKQRKCHDMAVVRNSSGAEQACYSQDNTCIVNTYDSANTSLADAQALSKSSSEVYYEALPMATQPKSELTTHPQAFVAKTITYSLVALKEMNAKWTTEAANTALRLKGTHTGESSTDSAQKQLVHLHATGSNCCRLSECLHEFDIATERKTVAAPNHKSNESLTIENWRAKRSTPTFANEDLFRSFNGYRLHNSFRKNPRWSASNISGKTPYQQQRGHWQEQYNTFKYLPTGSSFARPRNTEALMKTARLSSQALLRSLKQFNFETLQPNAVHNKETFMEELQDISQLLKRFQKDIDELQGHSTPHQQRLTTSSEPYLHQAVHNGNLNLVSIYATKRENFRLESSSDSEEKNTLLEATAGGKLHKEQRHLNVPLYEEVATGTTQSCKTTCTPNMPISEPKPTIPYPVLEQRCTPQSSFIGVESVEDLPHPQRTSYTTYTIVTPSYVSARHLADTAPEVITPTTPNPQIRLFNIWRQAFQIMSNFTYACFSLAHQRGGFAFFLMVLLFLFLVLVMFINSSKV